jgi:hypothetical protein
VRSGGGRVSHPMVHCSLILSALAANCEVCVLAHSWSF